MLIVLHNAVDAAQVRPLTPGTPGNLVVVTSRNRLTAPAVSDGAPAGTPGHDGRTRRRSSWTASRHRSSGRVLAATARGQGFGVATWHADLDFAAMIGAGLYRPHDDEWSGGGAVVASGRRIRLSGRVCPRLDPTAVPDAYRFRPIIGPIVR